MMEAHIAEACRFYIAVVLIGAIAGKARALPEFQETISEITALPPRWSRVAAVGTVATEAMVLLLLLLGGESLGLGMAAALALFLGLTAILGFALLQRKAIACNCFGEGTHEITILDIVRNLAMIAACGLHLGIAAPHAPTTAAAFPLLAGVAVILFLLTTNLNVIAGLWRT